MKPISPSGVRAANGTDERTAPAKATVRNITFKDIDLTLKNAKVTIERVEGLTSENAKINGTPLAAGK